MNIYLFDISEMPDDAVGSYTPLMDPDRRERIESCRRPQDRKRSLAAGLLLYYAWRERFPKSPFPEIARRADGKPYFADRAVPFGLSHSGHYAVCVLADHHCGAVGIDIQEPRRILPGVVERFFSEGEKEQVRGGEDPILIWSRKESLVKYSGRGLRGDLRRIDTSAGLDGARIRSFWTEDGYAVSVCTADDHVMNACEADESGMHTGSGHAYEGRSGGGRVCPARINWRQLRAVAENLRTVL